MQGWQRMFWTGLVGLSLLAVSLPAQADPALAVKHRGPPPLLELDGQSRPQHHGQRQPEHDEAGPDIEHPGSDAA